MGLVLVSKNHCIPRFLTENSTVTPPVFLVSPVCFYAELFGDNFEGGVHNHEQASVLTNLVT